MLRELTRHPAFTCTAVASFALAVGANTAIFSIGNALWLRPLPIAQPERVVVVYSAPASTADAGLIDSFNRRFQQSLERLDAFEGVTFELNSSGLRGDWAPVIRSSPDAEPIRVRAVSHNYFAVLGVPIEGRTFLSEEDAVGAAPVAILSSAFARQWFGADRPVGAELATTRGRVPVVGVVRSSFVGARLGEKVDLWITLGGLGRFSDLAASSSGIQRLMPLTVIARLRNHVTVEVAEAQVRSILGSRVTLRTLNDVAFPLRATNDLVRQEGLLKGLWLIAGLVLLLGCANSASLFLARTEARRQEFAIRVYLGSSPAALAFLVLREVILLTVLGFAAGLLVCWVFISSIWSLILPSGLSIGGLDPTLDWRVVVFAAGVAAVAGTVAVLSALRHGRRVALGATGPGAIQTIKFQAARSRRGFLVCHVALSMVLLVGGLALIGALINAYAVGFGFRSHEAVFLSVRPRLAQYSERASGQSPQRLIDYQRLTERLQLVRGVRAVTYGPRLLESQDDTPPENRIIVDGTAHFLRLALRSGGPDYLRTLGVPIVAGRDITASDERRAVDIGALLKDPEIGKLLSGPGTIGPRSPGPEGYPVAVIDRQLAAILWPGSSPLGKTFSHGFLNVTYQVVGVVDTIRHGVLSDSHVPTLVTYNKPDSLAGIGDFDLVLQVQDPQNGPLAEIGAVVREVFPDPASLKIETASAVLAIRTGRQRLVGTVVSYCALISAVLALVGVAGLVTYLIAHSQHELGIRAAVGATPQNLQRMLVRRAIVPVAIGVSVGALCSWQMMKLLSATLNITTPGTLVYMVAGVTLLGASGIAAVLATLRLRAIDPAVALRRS